MWSGRIVRIARKLTTRSVRGGRDDEVGGIREEEYAEVVDASEASRMTQAWTTPFALTFERPPARRRRM
jgi:hypothetical protein